jgi:serine/threonine-protein kinase HipA
MKALAKKAIHRRIAVPGVQPKLSLSKEKQKGAGVEVRLTVIGALEGQYILKPPSKAYSAMPENEHVTMRMAEEFGIPVVPSSLIRLSSGERAYITRRVDRTAAGEKIHMIDMYQITEAFDKYKGSVEKVGKALSSYSANPLLDKTYVFDIVLFSFLTGNSDMHLKNFSMIEGESGWVLSPAYDLLNVAIVFPADEEESALTLNGKKNKLSRSDFEQLGRNLGLNAKQIRGTFRRMVENKPAALDWIHRSFLPKDQKTAYLQCLHDRYERIA